jgi:tripartite-type tricarboxylate transporter receptor subunit TctC
MMTSLNRRDSAKKMMTVLGAALLCSPAAFAQTFPSKPITLVVGFAAGGGTDIQARALARAAAVELGQPIVVENRPGVSATLGPAAIAYRSAPDGYTLAVTPATLFRVPHMMKVNYDALKDFSYVINVTSYSYSLSVGKNAPWKNAQEFIAYAKAHPGKLNFSSTGTGGTGQITALRLAKLTGTEFNAIPYKSSGESFAAVMGGHVDFTVEGGFGPHYEGGNVRSLGIFSGERLKKHPSLPTLREQGFDIVAKSSWGIGGPKGMDPKVVKVLHDAFHKAMNDPEFLRVLDRENQPLTYMNSADYTRHAAELLAEEGKFIRELGIKAE